MQTGHIVHLFRDKAYGRIRTQDGEEVHFHEHCTWGVKFDELREGQKVEFQTQLTLRGMLGSEVRPV